jgi:hypothetical protein
MSNSSVMECHAQLSLVKCSAFHVADYSRFRGVACQIDFLYTLANDRERREALEKLPPTLPETYERILQRANSGGEHKDDCAEVPPLGHFLNATTHCLLSQK